MASLKKKKANGSITERNWVLRDGVLTDSAFNSLSSRYKFPAQGPAETQTRRSHISSIPLERDRDFVIHDDNDENGDRLQIEINDQEVFEIANAVLPSVDGSTYTDHTVYLDDYANQHRPPSSSRDHQSIERSDETSVTYSDNRFISTLSTKIITRSRRSQESYNNNNNNNNNGNNSIENNRSLLDQLIYQDQNGATTAVYEKRLSAHSSTDNVLSNQKSMDLAPPSPRNGTPPPLPLTERPLHPSSSQLRRQGVTNTGYVCDRCGRVLRDRRLYKHQNELYCPECDVVPSSTNQRRMSDDVSNSNEPMTRMNPLYRSDTATRKDSLRSAPPDIDDNSLSLQDDNGHYISQVSINGQEDNSTHPNVITYNNNNKNTKMNNGGLHGTYSIDETMPEETASAAPSISPRMESLHASAQNHMNGSALHAHFEMDRLSAVMTEPLQNLAHNRKFCAAVLFVIFFAALIGVGIGLTIYLD